MEPDLVLTIEHSLRMAIDTHNEEKKRQKNEEELAFTNDEVEAYAEVYRAWLEADKFKRESNSKNKAAWPSWFELDPKTKAFMQYLYRKKDDGSERWEPVQLERPDAVRPDELRPAAMSPYLADIVRTATQ